MDDYPMPVTPTEMVELKEWVMDRVLGSVTNDWVLKQIQAAIKNPDADPVKVARWAVGRGGFCGPDIPDVQYDYKGIVVHTAPLGEYIVTISYRELVEHVRSRFSSTWKPARSTRRGFGEEG